MTAVIIITATAWLKRCAYVVSPVVIMFVAARAY